MNATDLVEVPLQFQLKTSGSTRLLVLKPGFYWNPAAGWEAIGATGQPTAGQLFTPTRFSAGGVNNDLWAVTLRLDPDDVEDASIRLYTSDAAGNGLTAVGWWGIDPSVLRPEEPEQEPVVISNIVLQGLVSKR